MDDNVRSYDDTTLFCPAGMQQFKPLFKDETHKGTISNIQSCLRLNDLEEIGDGSHLLYFNMIGLFSFRELTVQDTIHFWMKFLQKINCIPDYVTIHPDKPEWRDFYSNYNIEIRYDEGCIWSDGDIGGYCTEFYKDDIEIGNIVNPLGTCIDVGFGLDRIVMVLTGEPKSKEETLRETIFKIIESGFYPSYNKQGSILRKLLRICYLENIVIDHQFYRDEIIRQEKILHRYNVMSKNPKFKDKLNDRDFWFNTIGLDIDLL
jgi:alanyl-tRNA synthetase